MYKYSLSAVLFAVSVSAVASTVHKCTINGKTVYSNDGCEHGSAKKVVAIQHAAGVVSPDRATIGDTLERARLQRWVDEQPGRSATRTTTRNGQTSSHSYDNPLPVKTSTSTPNKKTACAAYEERIRYLDGMVRQPQSASTQDWIKIERAKTFSAIYDAKC